MSQRLFPIPVATPIQSKETGSDFAITWQRYFKAIGDDLMEANLVKDSADQRALKYVLNANICFCNWAPIAPLGIDTVVALPFTAALPFQAFGTVYPAGATEITIPSASTFEQFFYIVKPTKV
jgi:hypothetical protein